MKILVVFGSKSDETVSIPLVEALSKTCDVEYHVISAHRDLEKLQRKITTWKGDAVVAGAGLAAALPGVVAAMTSLPVFGMPVPSQFGGMDSVCSIAQMPPGVPVMTCGPAMSGAMADFIGQYGRQPRAGSIHFVGATAHPDLLAEIEKAKALGAENGIEVSFSDADGKDAMNVYVVTRAEEVRPDAFALHMPFMPRGEAQKPENYLKVLEWMNKGGIWVGVNNTRNAVHSFIRLQGLPAMIYCGSVKNVRGVQGQSPYIFEFSDRYSIFDWGAMPDRLSGKGQALAWMSWFFFDYLQREQGILHHALGLVGDAPTRLLAVKPVQVIAPGSATQDGKLIWDYSAYRQKPENTLVPLEVIFRFGVPEGSSLLKRAADPDYCRVLGLTSSPKTGDRFEAPVVELSTKLETSDRYLDHAQACEIAGLSDAECQSLFTLTRGLALALKKCFAGIGVELWDGKFEFAFTGKGADGARGFMLVDSIGPDELRLTRDGVHLSKEALRGAYRPTPWHAGVEKAKQLAGQRGEKDWKRICREELHQSPQPLPVDVREQAEMIYKSLAKALSMTYGDGTAFADAWSIEDVVKKFSVKKQNAA